MSTPTARYAPADAPRLRREMVEWTRDYAVWWTEYMLGQRRQALYPDAPTARHAAEVLAAEETARLTGAEVFYADAEVAALVQRIAPSMPLFAPRPWDFPAPTGFILFGEPLAARPIDDMERAHADRMGIDADLLQLDAEVVAASWGPWEPGGRYPGWATALPTQAEFWRHGGGMWISFYADRHPLSHERATARRAEIHDQLRRTGRTARGLEVIADADALVQLEQLAATDSPLHPENETAFALRPEELPPGATEEDYGIADIEGTISPWARALLATFLLMRQDGVGQATTERVARPERKRHTRAKLPDTGDIHVIRLHRRTPTPATPGAATPTGRHLSVRFPVGPFWRNQYYPSTKTHRPKLIAQYLKGPADAPLVGADRVRVITAPPQETP